MCSLHFFSQESDGYDANLHNFYKRNFHFGFGISINSSDFLINPKPNSLLPDTIITQSRYAIKTIYSNSSPNFGIGLISDIRIYDYVRFRFTPSLTFADRKIIYSLATADRDSFRVFEKSVESAFLMFPIELKLQSKRYLNFGAYYIGGGGYLLDLTSIKNAGSSYSANQLDNNVKLERDDFFYSSGVGADFYLKYFKLGLELKLLIGTKSLLKKGSNVWINSIDKVRSRMVIFSVTFEG